MKRIPEILDFWFEGVDDSVRADKSVNPFRKWFNSTPALDAEMKLRFEADLLKAAGGEYQDWETSPEGALALILLFDQFSRNIYRNTLKMYAFDGLAQELAQKVLEKGWDQKLPLIRRMFIYMPFHHAEDPAMQSISVECFQKLVGESERLYPESTPYHQYNLQYAQKHKVVLEKDGRFVHRDKILNRSQ